MNKYKIIQGTNKILLSAPHNFPQIRKGFYKPRDINTGFLVQSLSTKNDCFGIYTTDIQDDPNWHKDSIYRKKLFKLVQDNEIQLVMDIHGKKNSTTEKFTFYPNKAFLKKHPKLLSTVTVKNFIDDDQLTICEDLDNIGVPAIEVEIIQDYRVNNTKYTINFLSSFLGSSSL